MKRLDLVQLTFIIVGICSAFFCIDLIPTFFIYLFLWLSEGLVGGYLMEEFFITIMLLALYLIFSIYSIRNSKQLAAWVTDKANLHGEVNFSFSARDILFAFFTGLAVFGLIRDLPSLFTEGYHYFKNVNTDIEEYVSPVRRNKEELFTQICKIGLMIVLLVYAHVFAEFLAARIKNTEPDDEIMQNNN